MFQMASPQDRAELKDLWQLCFQESQPFLDWFFTDRFLPAYCPIYREDGVIQAALHGPAPPICGSVTGSPPA